MDYRFTMTSRLIAIAVISFLLLLGLLFALGFQIGQQWGAEEATNQHKAAMQHAQQFKLPAVPALPTIPEVAVPAPPVVPGLVPSAAFPPPPVPTVAPR
jgi:type II secretory pathway pseudopilin PulG